LFQIISPVVAEAINANKTERIQQLLKKSSSNLLWISGVFFLLINLNLNDFYQLIAPEYRAAFLVVQLVSIGKLYSMSMGCLNQIISNSRYYAYVLFFSVFSAILAVVLNIYFIPLYGLLGAAYATLIIIVIINSLKIVLIVVKMQLHPFSSDTLKILGCIGLIFTVFYGLVLPFQPVINILLKSAGIGIVYTVLLYFTGALKGITSYLNRKASDLS